VTGADAPIATVGADPIDALLIAVERVEADYERSDIGRWGNLEVMVKAARRVREERAR
jgi:hypothetical protein